MRELYLMRVFALSFLIMFSSFVEANAQWRLDKDEEGIKVFLRDTQDSAVKSFKGTMTVNSLPQFLTARGSRWV